MRSPAQERLWKGDAPAQLQSDGKGGVRNQNGKVMTGNELKGSYLVWRDDALAELPFGETKPKS